MKRVAKPAGRFNIAIEEIETPTIAPTEVLVRAERSRSFRLVALRSTIMFRYTLPRRIIIVVENRFRTIFCHNIFYFFRV